MGGFELTDLLHFEKMVATRVMKFLYFVGLIGIIGFGLFSFIGSFAVLRYNAAAGLGTMLIATIGTALGVLIWRVVCELWLLGFNIFDRLGEIRDRTR